VTAGRGNYLTVHSNRQDTETPLSCTFETTRTWETPWCVAHNPEVAGSNPVPATSRNGPRRSLRGPFSCPMDTRLDTLARLASVRFRFMLDQSVPAAVLRFWDAIPVGMPAACLVAVCCSYAGTYGS
jgi:hypothetical protein